MEDLDLAKYLIQNVIEGGGGAIISILLGVIGALLYDRRSITKSLNELTEKSFQQRDIEASNIREIIEKYHQGNLNLVQALNEIKIVLVALQNSNR